MEMITSIFTILAPFFTFDDETGNSVQKTFIAMMIEERRARE